MSQVLSLGRGSCSRRLALLEAVARASDTAPGCAPVVDGAFRHARLPGMRLLVPHRVLPARPEFRLDGPGAGWRGV
ncbi:hypothetical protein SUDANB120_00855 [Streptomyces sp. enrichment culture]|uniref:hypothetical protein n=1 Tax=Streptomyces sp. enrichment culture TaxID=1795815 RepID=UPI003F548018